MATSVTRQRRHQGSMCALLLALAGVLVALPLTAQEEATVIQGAGIVTTAGDPMSSSIYVATSANNVGVGGANWRTDLEIHNSGKTPVPYTIALLKKGQDNTTPTTKNYSIPAGTSKRFIDVLGTEFSYTGSAALRITPLTEANAADESGPSAALGSYPPLHVTSRTYNDQPGGTYGQFVAGVWEYSSIGTSTDGRLIELTHTAGGTAVRPGDERALAFGYRTNIGAVNTSAVPITIEIKLYLANGTLVGTYTLNLKPYEFNQVDKIFEKAAAGTDVPDGFAILSLKSESGSFLAYASVIDNRTADPIYVPVFSTEKPCGGEVWSAVTFGLTYDNTSANPTFPASTLEIWAAFTYRCAEASQPLAINWYQNGIKVLSSTSRTYGTSGSISASQRQSTGFFAGNYRVDVVYKGAVAATGTFKVQ
jgi:hypothetical protein